MLISNDATAQGFTIAKAEPEHEEVHRGFEVGDPHLQLAEVDLRLLAGARLKADRRPRRPLPGHPQGLQRALDLLVTAGKPLRPEPAPQDHAIPAHLRAASLLEHPVRVDRFGYTRGVRARHATLFMTSCMLPEFARNEGNVRQGLTRHLQKIDDSVEVAAECLKLCGSPIATVRLSDSTLRAQLDAKYVAIVDACEVLEDDDEAKSRAMDRVVGQRRPSRQGNGLDANII